MTTTTTNNGRAEKARGALAKATTDEEQARKALAAARAGVRKAGKALLAALAGDLNLTAAERRALGLPKGGAR